MSPFFQGKSNTKHISRTAQSTLVCKQRRFLSESQFCLASRNSTGIKLARPIGSRGPVLGGVTPEASVSNSHHRTGPTVISRSFCSRRTQRSDKSLTSSITDRSALGGKVGKARTIVTPTGELQPPATTVPEPGDGARSKNCFDGQRTRTASLPLAPNSDFQSCCVTGSRALQRFAFSWH